MFSLDGWYVFTRQLTNRQTLQAFPLKIGDAREQQVPLQHSRVASSYSWMTNCSHHAKSESITVENTNTFDG